MGRKVFDLTGKRFLRLTAICKVDEMYDGRHVFWKCKCDCGNEVVVRKDSLLDGHAKSCGCYLQERYKDGHLRTHGMKNTRLYKIWSGMKDRCLNEHSHNYSRYGGRGINICQEWIDNFIYFYNWAMENGYADDLSIDRIDVNGNYEPNNCRWVVSEVQNYNKTITVKIKINGEYKTLKDIEKEYGIPLSTLRGRYKRFSNGKISLDEFLSKKRIVKLNKKNRIITVNGESKRLCDWERETGINRKTISQRYYKGKRTYEELFKKA